MGHYVNSPKCPNNNSTNGNQGNRASNNCMNNTGGPHRGNGVNVCVFTFYLSGHGIPSTWILLDSQSPMDIFCNSSLIENMHSVPNGMQLFCNARTQTTNIVGDLPGYGPVGLIQRLLPMSLASERNIR